MATNYMQHKGWKALLKKLINEHNKQHSVRNKVVGVETQRNRADILFQAFAQLRLLGYKIENPHNFQERHFKALLKFWLDENLSASTIQKRASIFRTFSAWIGKGNMIMELEHYVEDKKRVARDQVARVDKSWSAQGVSAKDILKQMGEYDVRLLAQMSMISAFGLRKQEAICFKPRRAIALGEHSNSILIEFGTKGGRVRSIAIDSNEQRQALQLAVNIAKRFEDHIGWEGLSLKQAINRFSYMMLKFGVTNKELGVTAHGLRHEDFNDVYEEITGQPSPVRGGIKGNVNPELDRKARIIITNRAGHSRLGVASSYFGSFYTKQE